MAFVGALLLLCGGPAEGITWSDPIRIAQPNPMSNGSYDLTTDAQGKLHWVNTDFDVLSRIYYRNETQESTLVLSGVANNISSPQIAISPDGIVTIGYYVEGLSEYKVAKFVDGINNPPTTKTIAGPDPIFDMEYSADGRLHWIAPSGATNLVYYENETQNSIAPIVAFHDGVFIVSGADLAISLAGTVTVGYGLVNWPDDDGLVYLYLKARSNLGSGFGPEFDLKIYSTVIGYAFAGYGFSLDYDQGGVLHWAALQNIVSFGAGEGDFVYDLTSEVRYGNQSETDSLVIASTYHFDNSNLPSELSVITDPRLEVNAAGRISVAYVDGHLYEEEKVYVPDSIIVNRRDSPSENTTGCVHVEADFEGIVEPGQLWRIDGGAWQENDTDLCELAPGAHTVEFKPVTGYITPASQQVVVNTNFIVLVEASYEPASAGTGSVTAIIKPREAAQASARWRVDGGPWQKSKRTVNGLGEGSHRIDFKDVSNWITPKQKQVMVTAGGVTEIRGKYKPK